MIAHYLAVALAKFRRSPFITSINVLTLALGLACFIAAWGITSYWRSADSQHPGADRLYYVSQRFEQQPNSPTLTSTTISAARLAADLRTDVPEIEAVGRISQAGPAPVSTGGTTAFLWFVNADPEILDLLSFEFIEGDPATALRGPEDIILVEDAARRYFGEGPALGRTLRINNSWDGTVVGVIAPVKQPSFLGHGDKAPLRFEALRQFDHAFRDAPSFFRESYRTLNPTTIVRLPPTMTRDAFAARLDDLVARRAPPPEDGETPTYMLPIPLGDITMRLIDQQIATDNSFGLSLAVILPGLGLLILVIAAVNYANLATTQALARAKEAGMRTTLGARRLDLVAQHWLEAALTTLAALVVALAVAAAAAPVLWTLAEIDALRFLKSVQGIVFLLGVALVTSMAAAAYPVIALSRIKPVDALGAGRRRFAGGLTGKIFVGLQFLSASFLLIMVTVMSSQQGWLREITIDRQDSPVVVLGPLNRAGIEIETLRAELAAYPQIESVTILSAPPWTNGGTMTGISQSPEIGAAEMSPWIKTIDHDYFATLDQDLLAGRVFDREHEVDPEIIYESSLADPAPLVIDENFARRLGFQTPQAAVGATIYQPAEQNEDGILPARAMEIIGVVAADRTRIGASPTDSTMYQFDPVMAQTSRQPGIRVARDDVPGALAAIDTVWRKLSPDVPLTANLYGDLFERGLEPFKRIQATVTGLSLCAFIIATTGLLGVAAHAAARRRHEIGVRKTLGSSTLGIVRLLLVDFAKPALAANLLAWPLAYLAAQAYLSAFSYRMPLTPAPFLFSMALTLAIAWAAVMGEVLKAASVRPAEVLRHA